MRFISGVGIASTVLVTGLLAAAPAQAATGTITSSCSADGQTASVRVTTDIPYHRTIYRVEYKISDNGRSEGNVYINDYGVAPTKTYSTASARQDGSWHTLREANYGRGLGDFSFKVTFDQFGSDPSCGKVMFR